VTFLPIPGIYLSLLKIFKQSGINETTKEYYHLKNNYSGQYDFGEIQLNLLGYHLLRENNIEDAIRIFKLNVEAFPDIANTYDSLGEAYMINGDKESAINNYKKALELQPGSANALKMLKKLHD